MVIILALVKDFSLNNACTYERVNINKVATVVIVTKNNFYKTNLSLKIYILLHNKVIKSEIYSYLDKFKVTRKFTVILATILTIKTFRSTER